MGTERDVVYADGSATFHGSGMFTGNVAGRSGTATYSYEGIAPAGQARATWVLVGLTGSLASVKGHATFVITLIAWGMPSWSRCLPPMARGNTDVMELRILRGRSAGVALLSLALLAQNVAAATIAINVASSADAIRIEASALLDADAQTAWRVLTDYDHYAEFIPGLQTSRVVARKGAIVTVEQSGNVMLWLLPVSLDVTFEITEVAPAHLLSRVVAGDLRALNSRYTLTPGAAGLRLEYSGALDSGFALFDPIERFAVRQNVARRFQALANEIERRSAAGRE